MARILIIDDDPAMVQVISDICQERGHQTVAYSSGQKALENLANHAPQLVITDVRMDKIGGMDVLRECREVLPGTPVIMITAYKMLETGIEAMKMGAYDYITKPFKVDELQLSIQRALDHQHDRSLIDSEVTRRDPPTSRTIRHRKRLIERRLEPILRSHPEVHLGKVLHGRDHDFRSKRE